MTSVGTVYFVGAGPGDPALLTVRARDVVARADAVVADADVAADVLALAPASCVHSAPFADVAATADALVAKAREGAAVVRLVRGDPLLFSRSDEEIAAVSRAHVPFEVVPGIPPFVALGAFAATALTSGQDASPCLVVASVARGREPLHRWEHIADAGDLLVFDADAASVDEIARALVLEGRAVRTPCAFVVDVALPTQRIVQGTLEDIAAALRPGGARRGLLAVGNELVASDALRWFDRRPLFGRRVLVTRSKEQAPETVAQLRARGAVAISVPTIGFEPPTDDALTKAVATLPGGYDWVAFTSANGVDYTLREVERSGRDVRAFGGCRIAAIGPATARALDRRGLRADLVATEFKGEGLADELLRATSSAPSRLLLPRAQSAREALPELLRASGWHVDVVDAYETRSPPAKALAGLVSSLEERTIDAVLFTSSSTVDNLCDLLGTSAAFLLSSVRVASIGPITTSTAIGRGLRVDVTAERYTVPELVAALERSFAGGA